MNYSLYKNILIELLNHMNLGWFGGKFSGFQTMKASEFFTAYKVCPCLIQIINWSCSEKAFQHRKLKPRCLPIIFQYGLVLLALKHWSAYYPVRVGGSINIIYGKDDQFSVSLTTLSQLHWLHSVKW